MQPRHLFFLFGFIAMAVLASSEAADDDGLYVTKVTDSEDEEEARNRCVLFIFPLK